MKMITIHLFYFLHIIKSKIILYSFLTIKYMDILKDSFAKTISNSELNIQ